MLPGMSSCQQRAKGGKPHPLCKAWGWLGRARHLTPWCERAASEGRCRRGLVGSLWRGLWGRGGRRRSLASLRGLYLGVHAVLEDVFRGLEFG